MMMMMAGRMDDDGRVAPLSLSATLSLALARYLLAIATCSLPNVDR